MQTSQDIPKVTAEYAHPHGLTPPMHNAKKKMRKVVHQKFTKEEIVRQVKALLRADFEVCVLLDFNPLRCRLSLQSKEFEWAIVDENRQIVAGSPGVMTESTLRLLHILFSELFVCSDAEGFRKPMPVQRKRGKKRLGSMQPVQIPEGCTHRCSFYHQFLSLAVLKCARQQRSPIGHDSWLSNYARSKYRSKSQSHKHRRRR